MACSFPLYAKMHEKVEYVSYINSKIFRRLASALSTSAARIC